MTSAVVYFLVANKSPFTGHVYCASPTSVSRIVSESRAVNLLAEWQRLDREPSTLCTSRAGLVDCTDQIVQPQLMPNQTKGISKP
jgi:hypothetical protein